MTIEITLQVPDTLGKKMQRFQDRLPEILERGLRQIMAETSPESSNEFQDEAAIIALLTSQPTPQEVLDLHASPKLQSRVSELLTRRKTGHLSVPEELELERHLMLEHLVRLAKAHAYQQLSDQR
ncbi:MAG: hypothetical protein ACLFTI_11100 [Anaerolineales bacterium]